MSITSVIEAGVVFNSVEDDDTLEDIIDYIDHHVDAWGNRHILWDMTLFNFQSLDQHSIRSFKLSVEKISRKRTGLKTAILVNSDLGFGMTRMYETLVEEKNKEKSHIFKSKDQAFKWLSDNEP